MISVSKEESTLLIQHAISANRNEGGNQKNLSVLLDLEEPRISEYKVGKGRLLSWQRQIIIDNYGYPRRGKGQYIKGEVCGSVTEFINGYEESSNKRLKHRLYTLFMSKKFQNELSRSVRLTDSSSKELGVFCRIDDLLAFPQTKLWYEYIKSHGVNLSPTESGSCISKYEHKVEDIEAYISQVGLSTIDTSSMHLEYTYSEFMSILYRIAGFKYELMPEFRFDNDVDIEPVVLNDLVITGDVVLELKPNSVLYEDDEDKSNVLRDRASLLFNDLSANLFGHHRSLYKLKVESNFNPEISYQPDYWSRIVMRLYLSENMNYHLWIRLDNGGEVDSDRTDSGVEEVRNIVIKDLCRLDFLNEMELIRKWCGYTFDINIELKHEVAKLGGYIPGAKVL